MKIHQIDLFQSGAVIQTPYINVDIKLNNWLRYGNDNLFPNYVSTLSSTTHDAIIRRKIQFAIGNGLHSSDPFIDKFLKNMPVNMNLNELVRRMIHDYVVFGGITCLCLFNAGGLVVRMQHLGFQTVRAAFPEWLTIDGYYVSNNWAYYNTTKNRPSLKIAAFGSDSGEGREILYTHQYDLGGNLQYYPVPSWFAAKNDIYAESQMAINRVNYIENNFTGNLIFMFPKKLNNRNADGQLEAQNAVIEEIEFNYTGAANAGKVLGLYGEPDINGASQMPQVHEIGSKNRVDEYNNQQAIVEANIAKAHGVTSPVLLGVSGNAALGNNASEIETAMQVFFNIEIKPIQAYVIEQIEKVLAHNNMQNNLDAFPSGTLYFDNPSILEGLEKDEAKA